MKIHTSATDDQYIVILITVLKSIWKKTPCNVSLLKTLVSFNPLLLSSPIFIVIRPVSRTLALVHVVF